MKAFARRVWPLAFAAVLSAPPALAAQPPLKGELKLRLQSYDTPDDSLSATLGAASHSDASESLRLMGDGHLGDRWRWELAWTLDLSQGEGVALQRRMAELDPGAYASAEQRNAFDLQHTLADHSDYLASTRIDRLNLSYAGAHAVLKIGRQALTWGSGLVFHPMDLFNPFAPTALDTEYKPGSDMLYGQWLFDSGADIQGALVPRRDPLKHHLALDQSAAGVLARGFLDVGPLRGYQLLLARNYDQDVLGVAFNGNLGGATWTLEMVPTRLADGSVRTDWLANLHSAWSCFSHNCSGYAEYYRNGFGVGGSDHTLAELPQSLNERIARGNGFSVSRNYLALGLDVQWTPLLNIQPLAIINLDDGSALLSLAALRSLGDNLNLTLALQTGLGPRGSEFGGLETAPDSGVYALPGRYLYARIDWYF